MTRPVRPERLGRFEVISKIAGGGLSTIYLGRSVDDANHPVAIKVVKHELRKNDGVRDMFVDEARLLMRLVHPNIVRTLEVGADEAHSFIAMELLLGTTLLHVQETCLSRGLGIQPLLTAWIGARIADALHHAHDLADEVGKPLSLIHRDVSPANVFVTFDGQVKLVDFGLAKYKGRLTEDTSPGIVKGKLPYLSPEQIMQMPMDRRSDLFGLGTTLWELLTMKRLFRRDTDVDTVRAVQRGPIPDPRTIVPEVPAALAKIVLRALERNREHRFASGAELSAQLDACVSAQGGSDMGAALDAMLQSLYPDEKKRQMGWLKPVPSRSMPPPPPRNR